MDWLSATRPLIIGHRGASADAPENTLRAFALALEHGADGFELDVQPTKDGELIIFHDFSLERLTGKDGRIVDHTLAELQAIPLAEGERMPTLQQLFIEFGNQPLYNVEIKVEAKGDVGVETAVAELIQAHQLEKRVLISSFDPATVQRARQVMPAETAVAILRYQNLPDFTQPAPNYQADHPYFAMVDEQYMAWANESGYKVNVWTVDDAQEAQRLIDLGVAGIITNKPQFMRQQLNL